MGTVLTPSDFEALTKSLEAARDFPEITVRAQKNFIRVLEQITPQTMYEDLNELITSLDDDGYNNREDYYDVVVDDLPDTLKNAMGYGD